MRYRVLIENKALKQLKNLDNSSQEIINKKLPKLKNGFIPELDISKLKGYKNQYRLRIGDYRILFELQKDHVIIIYTILHRKKAYK
jgi:mRNA interferase RelE/StbE